MQFTATGWVPVIDTALAGTADDAPQGFPFQIYGSIITGVNNPVANYSVTFIPNPVQTTSTVRISLPDGSAYSKSELTFVVYDVMGREIRKTEHITDHSFSFDREGLSNGIYSYKLFCQNQLIKQEKFVVQ